MDTHAQAMTLKHGKARGHEVAQVEEMITALVRLHTQVRMVDGGWWIVDEGCTAV
jgi:hypothetical protein